MGEVRGLLVENVKADHVEIRHSSRDILAHRYYQETEGVPNVTSVEEALAVLRYLFSCGRGRQARTWT